jgi:hypothetical protein
MSEEVPLPQSRAEDMNSMQDDRAEDDGMMKEEGESMNNNNGDDGSCHLRPIFFGNLSHGCMAGDVEGIFERLVVDSRGGDDNGGEFPWTVCFMLCLSDDFV